MQHELKAQEAHHSRISIVHPGFDFLKADTKALIDLTTAEEQKQWVNIQDYIDMFQIGIDGSRPVRMDVLTGLVPTAYVTWVPLAPPEDKKKALIDEFRDNLNAFGYGTTRDPQDRNLYRMENAEDEADTGWLRVIPDLRYALFVQTMDKQDMVILKQLLQKAGDPLSDVADILAAKPGIGVEGVNTADTAADQAKRREAFAELRKTSMETIQKRPEEATTEYELRKALLEHQLDEGERLMVEARLIRMMGSLDLKNHTASMGFTATAIPSTSLAASIESFGQQPDAFASVAKSPGSALSLRLNHPIDAMRQENAMETLSLTKMDIDVRIDASKEMTAAEKDSAKKMLSGILEVIQDGIRTGNVNAFVESVPNDKGEFSTIGAVSAPGASRLNDILPLLANSGKDNMVQMNADKAGDIPIHKVQLAEGFVTLIDRIFGVKQELYVGVAESHVWLASGPGGLESMKNAIGSLGAAAVSPTCIHIELKALPWVRHLEKIAKTSDEGKTLEEKEQQRSLKRTRDRAIIAMEGDSDQITLDVRVEKGVVTGTVSLDRGIVRFAGKMLAAFSKENLD